MPFINPYSFGGGNDSFTKLLLHCDGADASTTFTDSSSAARTVTVNGNAQIDTAQSKFGGASGLFDGTGDYLSFTGASSDFAFGTGDFTIDFWVRLNSVAATVFFYDGRTVGGNGAYPTLYLSTSLRYLTGAADRIIGATLSTGTWYHIALLRTGTSTMLFVDGVQSGSTYSDSTNYLNDISGRPYICEAGTASGFAINGWIDEFRVSKGIARWTGAFTPPSAPYS